MLPDLATAAIEPNLVLESLTLGIVPPTPRSVARRPHSSPFRCASACADGSG